MKSGVHSNVTKLPHKELYDDINNYMQKEYVKPYCSI